MANEINLENNILWPYLLEFIINPIFSPGLPFLCKILIQIIKKLLEIT